MTDDDDCGMSLRVLLWSCRIALKRKRQIPSEKRTLIKELTRYLNKPCLYLDAMMMAAGEREDDYDLR